MKNFSPYVVASDVNGHRENLTLEFSVLSLNGNSSGIYSQNMYTISKKYHTLAKPSEDKSLIGYTFQGLPFLVLIKNSSKKGHAEALYSFTDNFIVPLINKYALEASQDSYLNKLNYDFLIKKMVADIHILRAAHAPHTSFSLALGLCFQNRHFQNHCIGFGLGEVGLVLNQSAHNQNNEYRHSNVVQLVRESIVNQEDYSRENCFNRQTFQAFSTGNDLLNDPAFESMIESIDGFFCTVKQGDELIAYTNIMCEHMENIIPLITKECDSKKIERKSLNPVAFNSDTLVKDQLVDKNREQFQKLFSDEKANHQVGVETTICFAKIPNEILRKKLIAASYLDNKIDLNKFCSDKWKSLEFMKRTEVINLQRKTIEYLRNRVIELPSSEYKTQALQKELTFFETNEFFDEVTLKNHVHNIESIASIHRDKGLWGFFKANSIRDTESLKIFKQNFYRS